MKPPYKITNKILELTSSISEKVGEVKAARLIKPPTKLRKENRIKTIHSSLGIEGNSLTIEQITDLINNKKVLAPAKDILEVKNAIKVYSTLDKLDPYSLKSLCKAHGILMKGLLDNPGELRHKSVGIIKGEKVAHIAPPGKMVQNLLQKLFEYMKRDGDILLIKSSVFHYEFEFIHPFLDGNGRMGRLWQTLILSKYSPVFQFLPIETLIKERQQDYYSVLAKSDSEGNSTYFIEFILEIIDAALEELLKTQNLTVKNIDRIDIFKDIAGKDYFTRQDYLRHNKEISSATASRDLKEGVKRGVLDKKGEKRLTKYRYK
jgi:Fic family protein